MAYAGAEFTSKVLRAIGGEKGIVVPSYVHLSADKVGGEGLVKEVGKELEYFSANVEIGVRPFSSLFYSRPFVLVVWWV